MTIEFELTCDGWRICDEESARVLESLGLPTEPDDATGGAWDDWINEIVHTAPLRGIAVVFPPRRPLPEPPTVGNRCI